MPGREPTNGLQPETGFALVRYACKIELSDRSKRDSLSDRPSLTASNRREPGTSGMRLVRCSSSPKLVSEPTLKLSPNARMSELLAGLRASPAHIVPLRSVGIERIPRYCLPEIQHGLAQIQNPRSAIGRNAQSLGICRDQRHDYCPIYVSLDLERYYPHWRPTAFGAALPLQRERALGMLAGSVRRVGRRLDHDLSPHVRMQ